MIPKMGFDTIEITHAPKALPPDSVQQTYLGRLRKTSGGHNFCHSPIVVAIVALAAIAYKPESGVEATYTTLANSTTKSGSPVAKAD